ncbi:hypothetical protein GCM10010174_06730 [Kutzneria viridogrisea]
MHPAGSEATGLAGDNTPLASAAERLIPSFSAPYPSGPNTLVSAAPVRDIALDPTSTAGAVVRVSVADGDAAEAPGVGCCAAVEHADSTTPHTAARHAVPLIPLRRPPLAASPTTATAYSVR